MKLGLKDIHPAVADVLRNRIWSMRSSHQDRPEDVHVRTVLARRWKGLGWRILAAVPVGGVLGMGIAAAFGGPPEAMFGLGLAGAYVSALGTGVGSVIMGRSGRNTAVSAEELRALAHGLELDRPEAIYLETVCALLEAGGNVSELTGREILTTLNALLDQARHVCDRLERLRKAASTDSVSALREERARIAERLSSAVDLQARDDLEQSLTICDGRLRNAEALQPLVERLDAQREVIIQTLLSVQSAAARLQVAPTALGAPDVEEVKRVVSEVTAQTYAVEDAVQEVMALRS